MKKAQTFPYPYLAHHKPQLSMESSRHKRYFPTTVGSFMLLYSWYSRWWFDREL